MRFTVDHIIPEILGGSTSEENLCLACWDCNLIKQRRIAAEDPLDAALVPLFHPVKQRWHDHFAWDESDTLIFGLTASGRATVQALRLNRPALVRARERWVGVGWHPPVE